MNNAILSIPTDPIVTKKAQKKAEKEGLNFQWFFGTVFNKVLKEFTEKETIRTDMHIRLVEEPSENLLKAMKKAKENRKKGKHSPVFKTGEEAIAWLEKQGI